MEIEHPETVEMDHIELNAENNQVTCHVRISGNDYYIHLVTYHLKSGAIFDNK
jgi:hypothetical protein